MAKKNPYDGGDTAQTTVAAGDALLTTDEKLPDAADSDAVEGKAANNGNDSSKSREEGELSSSDDDNDDNDNDDEFDAAGSAPQYAYADTAQMESVHASPVNEPIQDARADKSGAVIKSDGTVGVSSRGSQHEENVKSSEKNREPFVPFVIRFSDDESGSDSDGSKHTGRMTKVNKQGVDRIIKQPVPTQIGSKKLQKDITEKARPIRREVPPSRPHVSTLTKINGLTPRISGQKSSFRSSSSLRGQVVQNQIPVRKTTLNLNSNIQELQDLRQLIAIRESELKLRAAQQTKNSVGGSYRDSKFRSPDNQVDRVRRAPVFDLRSESGESDKKRQKTGELRPDELSSGLHPILTSGKSSLMNCCREDVAGLHHCVKNQSLLSHGQEGKQVETQGTPPANPDGANEGNIRFANILIAGKTEKGAVGDFPRKSDNMELDHTQSERQGMHMSIPDMVASSAKSPETLDRDTINSKIVSKQMSDVRAQASPPHVLKTNLQGATHSNPNFFHDLSKMNFMVNRDMDLQSLLEYEELLDKEIEEAQEHRCKCEVEEKNALMAYRKAQRVLVEAHARCSQLYSKRELYSAQLRSYMMENPSLFSSQSYLDRKEAGFNSSNNVSHINVQLIPSSCHQVLAGSDVKGKSGYDNDIPSAINEFQNLSNLHTSEENLVSNPCHEPEGSPLNACKQPLSSGACSPSGDLSRSSYEDGKVFELNQKSAHENIVSEGISEVNEGREKDIYEESGRQGPVDSSEDCLLLEASLRAQLFEKLKAKQLSKRSTSVDPEVERKDENDNDGKMMDTDAENTVLHETDNGRHLGLEDGSQEERFPELPSQMNDQCDISNSELEYHTEVPVRSCVSLEVEQPTISGTFLFPAIKSALNNLKVIRLLGVSQCKSTSSDVLIYPCDKETEGGGTLIKSNTSIWSLDATESTVTDLFIGKIGSFSSDYAIDPGWPLCMYELRGKCNNDECPWQHVRDYSRTSIKPGDNSDTEPREQPGKEQFSSSDLLKKRDNLVLAPPIYVVGLDILRPDSHLHTSASPQGYGQCWQKSFSAFLVLSSLCPTVLRSNEPFLHGTEARIEVHSSWNRRLSYFQSRNGILSQLDQCTSDVELSVEMALLNLSEEADKHKSRVEAVQVLARAIEDDPTSAVLWIVYLLIFYSNQKSIGKDDLFEYAVRYNRESYELWLLYINSRVQLEDRLAAYNNALLALCCHPSKSDDNTHISQCILDIFLQMIDCLCMSGNVGRAIEKISELFSSKDFEDCSQLSIPNIFTCLTICDKFIFWMCCVYLLVYKKLPDIVVQRFECWKESSAIEWPSAHLRSDEKQQAASLLEIAVDSLESYVNHESLENEKTLRAAHLFAFNHVRCVSVLEGLECSRNLLEKYIKLYPSCLELVLMSARTEYELGDFSFRGFEGALRNWPDEVGLQCIWNQYAVFALQNGKLDFVRELMDRWLHSVLEAQSSDIGDSPIKHNSDQSTSAADLHGWFCTCGQNDMVFGMLNVSLYKLLQDDQSEARVALDLALKAAVVDNYQLCLRELVPFWLMDSIQREGHIHPKGILNLLNVHLVDTRVYEPLSRAFLAKIKKARVQKLVSKLLCPISADFSLMHMILEVWHGLTMLPRVFAKPRDLVDFAEAMMEVLPSNYLLGVSVCKQLCKIAEPSTFSASLSFWAGSLLVNALYHAVPVAPEHAWVEAAEVLCNLTAIHSIKESFHKKALAVHPFSIKLWNSYLHLSETEGAMKLVKEAAREKGIELG